MKESDLTRTPRVTPFSSGTEAMCWESNNCSKCKRNKRTPEMQFPDDMHLANAGRHCRWEIHLGYGWLDGSIAEYAAGRIGWTEEKGWPQQCILFIDKDDKGPPGPKRDKPVGPNQFKLFTEFDELLKPAVVHEIKA